MTKSHDSIRRVAGISVFCALALVSGLLPGIKVSFLTLDIKDAIITVGAMFFGPLSALAMSIAVPLLEMAFGSDTAFWGFIMNALGSAAFSVTAGWIYSRHRSLRGAIIGLCAGCGLMTAVMMGLNLVITPIYTGATVERVLQMMLPLLLPFNLIKSVFNAALVLVLYKPMMTAMRASHLIPRTEQDVPYRFDRKTRFTLVCGVLLLAVCVVLFVVVMKGRLDV